MAAHRYWRVYVSAVGAGGYVSLESLSFIDAAGVILSTGGTPSASSIYSAGYEATKAFDNDNLTIWHSGSGAMPEWLKYDFGAAVDVATINLRSRVNSPNQAPKDFKLQYSDDGTAWTDAATVTGATWADRVPQSFPKATKQAWRVYATATQSSAAFALSELEMRFSAGGANKATSAAWVFASTSFGGDPGTYGALQAIDGNTGTLWSSSGSPPASIGYLFGASVDVVEILMRARSDTANGSPTAFDVQYMDGAGSWVTAASFTGQTGWSAGLARTFTVSSSGVTAVGTTVATRWNAVVPAGKNTSMRWNTLAVANKAQPIRWNAVALATTSQPIRWNAVALAPTSQPIRWNAVALAPTSQPIRWNALAVANKASTLRWNALAVTSKTQPVRWNALAVANKASTLRWNMLSSAILAGNAVTVRWNSLAATSKSTSLRWNALTAAGRSQVARWNALAAVQQTMAPHWNMLAAAGVSRSLRWNMAAAVAAAVTARWNLTHAVPVAQAVTLRWHSITKADRGFVCRWFVGDPSNTRYDAIDVLVLPLERRVVVLQGAGSLVVPGDDRVHEVAEAKRVMVPSAPNNVITIH